MKRRIFQICCVAFVMFVTIFTYQGTCHSAFIDALEQTGSIAAHQKVFLDETSNLHVAWYQELRDSLGRPLGLAMFYKMVDKDGKVRIDKKQVGWAGLNPNITVVTKIEDYVIIAAIQSTAVSIIRLNSEGEIVSNKFLKWNFSPESILKNRDGNLFVIGVLNEGCWRKRPIFHAIFKPNLEIESDLTRINYEDKSSYQYGIHGPPVATFTSDHNILIFTRLLGPKGRPSNDNFLYFLMDTDGDILTDVSHINIKKAAFRKIEGTYLRDVDLVTLSNGEIIISAWSPYLNAEYFNIEENSIYQIRFSKEGKLIKAAQAVSTKPLPFDGLPETGIKRIQRDFGREMSTDKRLNVYYLFGFDKEETFYYSKKSFPWKW